MIKLGIIIDDISKNAGTERAVSSLANGILEFYPEDYTVSIISLFSTQESSLFFDFNPSIKMIHMGKTNDFNAITKVFWYANLIKELSQIKQMENFDILLGTTYIHNILLTKISGDHTKRIGCEHEVYSYPPKYIQYLRKLTYPKLDGLIVLNETEKKQYDFYPNSVIISNSIPFNREETSSLQEKRIISVGRITYQKGFDYLVDVAEKVHSKHPDWEFHIFGSGEDAEQIQAKIEEKKLENIVHLRGLTQEIWKEYAHSSIFLLTSRWESFGLVLIEAMNLGLPVVSFDCDGPKNIIQDSKNGYLIPKFDLDEMAAKIDELITHEDIRNEMGRTAKISSEFYHEKNIIPKWNQLFKSKI